MSNVKLAGNVSGTGSVTIASPNTNSDISISLPTVTGGSFVVSDASGNVGIGTSSPSAKLDVSTSINLSAQNYLNVAYDLGGGAGWLSGYNITYSSSSVRNVATGTLSGVVYGGSGLQFYTNTSAAAGTAASERMRIDTSGNVGIGTSSPDSRLTVQTTGASNGTVASRSGLLLRADNISTGFASSRIQWTYGGLGTSTKAYIEGGVYGSDYLAFSGNGTSESVRIDSNGNVGIGTSSLTLNTSGTVLHINNSTASRAAVIHMTNAESGSGATDGLICGKWSDGTNYFFDYDSNPIVFGTGGTNRAIIDTSGNFQFNSGYGSVATAYGCRAWVNFNGTGTPAIRASGNVSSITDNGTGDYTLNFATAMPDTSYCPVVGGDFSQGATRDNGMYLPTNFTFATGTLRISVTNYAGAYTDIDTVLLAIFR